MNRVLLAGRTVFFVIVAGLAITTSPLRGQQPDKTAALNRALAQLTQAEFIELPLSDVCAFLQDQHALEPFEIDEAALLELGLSKVSPTTVTVRQIPLAAALPLLLQNLSPKLEAMPKDGRLVITSTKNSWCTLRHNVRELTAADKRSDAGALRELVINTVSPTSWKEGGGKGVIQVEGAELVVENFARHQWEVWSLLAELRKNLIPGEDAELKTIGDRVRRMAKRILAGADKNGDGVVTGEEYESLRGYDFNRDQKVTLEECLEFAWRIPNYSGRRK